MSGTLLTKASKEWQSRPDDQRFLSLDELAAFVGSRKEQSWTSAQPTTALAIDVDKSEPNPMAQDLRVLFTELNGMDRALSMTNHAFTQLSSYAGAPAGYLTKLPAAVAALNLQVGLQMVTKRENALVLGQTNGSNVMRSITSTTYGRIWDIQVVNAVQRMNESGRWHVPAASYTTTNPRRATTLYASDRDVFLFLVADDEPLEIPGETHPMYRGFYTWNSETGDKSFGLSTFLYRVVCDNRLIWGARDVRELRIRHTGGAPERFAYEGRTMLNNYANASMTETIRGITAAKEKEIPIDGTFRTMRAADQQKAVVDWLKDKAGLKVAEATKGVESAVAEQGDCRSIWDVVQGLTAYARTIPHTDKRVELETKAGKLMDRAAA